MTSSGSHKTVRKAYQIQQKGERPLLPSSGIKAMLRRYFRTMPTTLGCPGTLRILKGGTSIAHAFTSGMSAKKKSLFRGMMSFRNAHNRVSEHATSCEWRCSPTGQKRPVTYPKLLTARTRRDSFYRLRNSYSDASSPSSTRPNMATLFAPVTRNYGEK